MNKMLHSRLVNTYLRIDEEEVHLQEGEEGLHDGVGKHDVLGTVLSHG